MSRWAIAAAIAIVLVAVAGALLPLRRTSMWLRFDSPGPLSAEHAFLKDNCAACHTPIAGVTRTNCVSCHSNESRLLARQPTEFHAQISDCAPCHYEHLRGVERPIQMDHQALARIAIATLGKGGLDAHLRAQFSDWMRSTPGDRSGPKLSPEERQLNCVTCHRVNDAHSGNFGESCGDCHATKTWFIQAYVHPSANSTECAQCHSATPCHYMGRCFAMMSGMEGLGAPVEQCYRCHKTTNWQDLNHDDRSAAR